VSYSIAGTALGAFLAGAGLSWFARGWYDGADVSAVDAAKDAQQFVMAGVESDRAIQQAGVDVRAAETRVEYVTRTVTVAAECPPGAGPISADAADRLREFVATRQAGAKGSGAD
jgi:hypothetical protein